MCDEPYMVIGLGNAYDFVIKNVNEPETYGTFHGDKYDQKSMKKFIEKVNRIVKENEQLKAQLYCDYNEGVCSICKHHYLENGNIFYISKCEKGHEKCSKESVRHCEDFELKELEND